jgi:hypothetical protein
MSTAGRIAVACAPAWVLPSKKVQTFSDYLQLTGLPVIPDFLRIETEKPTFRYGFEEALMAITNDACQLPASVLQLPDM